MHQRPKQPVFRERSNFQLTPLEEGQSTGNVSIINLFRCNNFTFGLITGDSNPSPNTYSLPSMIGPRVPNRVSSACYSMPGRISIGGFDTDYAKTPGPARYGTTTPDLYQTKAPNYTMLARNFMPGGQPKQCNNFYMVQSHQVIVS